MSCGIGFICFITLLELKGKPTSKTHFWVITLQTKPNFRCELEKTRKWRHTEVGEKKQGTRCLSNFGPPKSHGHPMGIIPQALSKNVVLTVSTQVKLRWYIYILDIIRYNRMMLYIAGKMMLIFLFHLQFGLPIFQLYMAFAMQLVDQHES
jgi:hypothetical protein